MIKTKIICSIGPVSNNVKVMKEMVLNGMSCARINLSHASHENAIQIIDTVREVRKLTNMPVAIMYDTKGPEFRTLEFSNGGITLRTGEIIKMVKENIIGNNFEFSINHPEAIDKIKVGNHVLIDNALLDLEVIDKNEKGILLKALNNETIKSHKTINVPGVNLELPFISETDKNDIVFAATHSCDYLALSFVNTKEDVLRVKDIISSVDGDAKIISKIESKMGLDNIDEIIEVSDGIMIARGDLGVETPLEELPIIQKEIILKCREAGKFAIVATEMLASMYTSARPTRAEVSDISNAVLDGTDCVMLSGETTIGRYPIEAVGYMSRICQATEKNIDYSKHPSYKGKINISDTIAKLVIDAVLYSNIKLIITPTMTGYTATKISNLRPNCPILACCPTSHIAEKVALNFGVKPIITEKYDDFEEIINKLKELAIKEFNLQQKDLIVITGGFPLGKTHATNNIRIIEV